MATSVSSRAFLLEFAIYIFEVALYAGPPNSNNL